MIFDNIKNMKNGWFVGDFDPSVFKNPFFEVAHQFHKKGNGEDFHCHKVTTEINYILKGNLLVSGKVLSDGDIFVYEAGEISDVVFLEDSDLIIVRYPSIPSDKHMVKEVFLNEKN